MATLFGMRPSARPNGAKVVLGCAGMVTRRALTSNRVAAIPGPWVPKRKPNNHEQVPPKQREEFVHEARLLPINVNVRRVFNKEPETVYHPTLFTLTTPYPSQLRKNEFINSLIETAAHAPAPHYQTVEARSIVILTTPSFATWVDDADFVGHMVCILNQKTPNIKHVQTTVAVVDGLFPPRQTDASSPVPQSAEGFSFMITSDDATAAKPSSIKALSDIYAESCLSSGLRFNFIRNDVDTRIKKRIALIEMIVPLANTLFRNGRKSTLIVANWVRDENAMERFRTTSLEYKETSAVRTEGFNVPSKIDMPLDELTKPRRIVAGLGNIVRQLEGDNGEPLPASTELEKSVVSYLTAKKLPQQQVSVWALVVPEEEMLAHQNKSPGNQVPWHLIRSSRAGLHRVLSGGGGWGAKAGLLSLDPDTRAPGSTGSQPDDDFTAFQNRFADVDERTQALGDIAKPGSYVWFLIAHEGLVDENGKLADLNNKKDTAEEDVETPLKQSDELRLDPYKKIRLGCIRSTIDDIPTANPDNFARRTETGRKVHKSMMHLSKDFSAQSELGLYVRIREEEAVSDNKSLSVTNASRIDVPGTTFEAWFKEYRLPGRFPNAKMRSKKGTA